jgi:hypothetical protein
MLLNFCKRRALFLLFPPPGRGLSARETRKNPLMRIDTASQFLYDILEIKSPVKAYSAGGIKEMKHRGIYTLSPGRTDGIPGKGSLPPFH